MICPTCELNIYIYMYDNCSVRSSKADMTTLCCACSAAAFRGIRMSSTFCRPSTSRTNPRTGWSGRPFPCTVEAGERDGREKRTDLFTSPRGKVSQRADRTSMFPAEPFATQRLSCVGLVVGDVGDQCRVGRQIVFLR